jgi:hypothetical protein
LEPPAEYLEEDITSKDDQRVPPDALYMLQSIRYYTKYFVITTLVGELVFKWSDGRGLVFYFLIILNNRLYKMGGRNL